MIGVALNNRYRIEVELGRGGMGVVYQARDTRLKRDVAVKVLSTGGLGAEGRGQLMNEARAAAQLKHPNIISVHDADEAQLETGEIAPFVVMELLDGPSLHEQPPQTPEETLAVTRQLCAALDHAHEQGVVHRDLKPENVMLDGHVGTVKLMDFGLARSVASRLSAEGAIMGTLFYMSPEMAMGQEVDGRADLYALGIMLYEWATGRLPFEAEDPVTVLTQHLHAPVVPPSTHNPDLSPFMEALILKLLAKDPAKRPWPAARVLEELDHLEEPETYIQPLPELTMLDRIVRGRLVGREAELAQARAIWTKAGAGQGQLFEEMVSLLSLLSTYRPLILLLEDLHWADSGSLAMLRHLVRSTRHLAVMILATYREVEIDQARIFYQLLLDFNRERLVQRIKLTRLDRQGTEALLAVLFDEPITPEFLESIYRETEGNPFFVEEVCKALVDSGKLVHQDGKWQRPSISDLGVPQSIQMAVQTRVQVLPVESQKILEMAAVLGREFDYETLVKATGDQEDAVLDALDDALVAQLIEEGDDSKAEAYGFIHALIPTAIVGGLRTVCRRRLHRRAAAALEATHPESYEALARLFVEGAEMEKGTGYLRKAGDRARLLYAHREAIEAYESVLEHLKETGQTAQAARLLMKLGGVYHNTFDFTRSRHAYDEAFRLLGQVEATTRGLDLPPAPHPLRLAWTEPESLDHGELSSRNSQQVIDQLFRGLVQCTIGLDVVPDVARRWEILDGGRRYRFYLRDDVVWSDGVPVTAYDFEFAWKQALNPERKLISEYTRMLYDIKGAEAYNKGLVDEPDSLGVRAIEDKILEVELEAPTAYFLQILAIHISRPLPSHVVKAFGHSWTSPDKIVTNGPFLLFDWLPGESMTLTRNSRYHGRFLGNLHSVCLSFGHDEDELFEAYEAGKLDIIDTTAYETLRERLRQRFIDELLISPELATFIIQFDLRQPPFDDIRVRQAFALALDREHLAEVVLGGDLVPATGGYVPPGMAGHCPGIASPFDPAKARRLLTEAGYPEGQGFPTVNLLYWGMTKLNLDIVRQWRQHLDIVVEAELYWGDDFVKQLIERRPNLNSSSIATEYPDPDDMLRGVATFEAELTGWHNERFKTLIDEAGSLNDQSRRLALFEEAERILIAEMPMISMLYRRTLSFIKPWVRQVPISPLGDSYWKDVIIDPH